MIEKKNLLILPTKILSMHLRNYLIILCMLSLPMIIIDNFIHSSFSIGFVLCLTLICTKVLYDYNQIKKELAEDDKKNSDNCKSENIIKTISEIKEN